MSELLDVEADVDSVEYASGGDCTLRAKEKAEADGFAVIVADDRMLLLDLDHPQTEAMWLKCRDDLADYGIYALKIESWRSKSNHGHVLIHLAVTLTAAHRVGLEVVLGSDRKRGQLSLRDIKAGCEYPCMLFRPAGAKVTVWPPEPLPIVDEECPF